MMFIHWMTAVCVVAAYLFSEDGRRVRLDPPVLHFIFGFAVLLLTIPRLLNRLIVGVPAPATSDAPWSRLAARWGQFLLYVLLLAIPVTGLWVLARLRIEIVIFGLPMPFFSAGAATPAKFFGRGAPDRRQSPVDRGRTARGGCLVASLREATRHTAADDGSSGQRAARQWTDARRVEFRERARFMSHLLLVDDDEEILSLLTSFFRKHAHGVSVATNGSGMYEALEKESIDLVILDVMLRDEDGFGLCRQLRAKSSIPIIMLTAVADHTDRVVGLELGADDYLTKPFDQRELLARVKAVLRRTDDKAAAAQRNDTRPVLRFAGWRLDVARRELRSADNALVLLSGGEFELLLAFAEHAQRVLTRDQFIDLARSSSPVAYDRSIDVQVSRLRHKLEVDPKSPELIRTVRNGGYVFAPTVTRE
jgi:two-component system OmpR family response regulator